MPGPNDLKYWNIWNAVNIAALKQPDEIDDIRQPEISKLLPLLELSKLCAKMAPTKTKLLFCRNDANGLGVLEGFSRNFQLLEQAPQ